MKIILLYINLIILNLIFSINVFSQFESILDSRTNKNFVGFKVPIPANQQTMILLSNKDSTRTYILIDTSLTVSQNIIVLFPETFSDEKDFYKNNIVIMLPAEIESGIYSLYFVTRKKFIYIR